MSQPTRAEIERDITAVTASHDRLVAHLAELTGTDPAQPSLLPGWTVGHVLTHLARNADGFVAMLDGAPMYSGGREGRNAAIDAGANRSWDDLVADVESTARRLDARWATVEDWSLIGESLVGPRPFAMMPFIRRREVELHRVDLGLGYRFDDLPSDYVRVELRLQEMNWRATKPMGMTPLPPAALALAPAQRLAWLTGRLSVDGLEPANVL